MKETPVNLKNFLVFYCPHITQLYLTRPKVATAVGVSVPLHQLMVFQVFQGKVLI